MIAIDPGAAYRGSWIVLLVFAVVFYGSIYAVGTLIFNSYAKWCQHRIDQWWYREHPGMKEKPIPEWTLDELQSWAKRRYNHRIRKRGNRTPAMARELVFGKMKSIRWFIFCALTSITGAKAFASLISAISILRWNSETTSALGLTPIEFALLACFNIGIWTAIAALSWTLRSAKDTVQRTPLKRFLVSLLLTVWVVGVFLLFAYDKAATEAAIKVAIPKLVEQIIEQKRDK
jgi:hypothetical protein